MSFVVPTRSDGQHPGSIGTYLSIGISIIYYLYYVYYPKLISIVSEINLEVMWQSLKLLLVLFKVIENFLFIAETCKGH